MPIMKKTVKNLQGFTLVEALLSVALLSLIFTAVSGAFIYGLQGQAWVGNEPERFFWPRKVCLPPKISAMPVM